MSGFLRVLAFLLHTSSAIFVGAMVPSPHSRHLLTVDLVWLLPRNSTNVLSLHLGLVHFVAVPLIVHLIHACQTARPHTPRFRFRLFAPTEDHAAGLLVFRRAILVQRLLLVASSRSGLMPSRMLSPAYQMHQTMTRLCLCLLSRYLRRLPPSQYLFQVLLNALHLHLNPLPCGVARRCLLPLRCTLRSVRLRSTQASLLLFLAHHPRTRLIST